MRKKYRFECDYCSKKFVSEPAYLKHRCRQMERTEALRTPEGLAAWQYYRDWLRYQRRRAPDDAKAFLTSNYYNAFTRFAEHVRKLRLPNVEAFIKLMVEQNYQPTLWTRDEVYSLYIQRLDAISTPKDLVNITLHTLYQLSVEYDCDISDIFDYTPGIYIAQLLRERKITPWLLLRSKKFKQFLVNLHKKHRDQYIALETIIGPATWAARFKQNKDIVNWIDTEVIPELGL